MLSIRISIGSLVLLDLSAGYREDSTEVESVSAEETLSFGFADQSEWSPVLSRGGDMKKPDGSWTS